MWKGGRGFIYRHGEYIDRASNPPFSLRLTSALSCCRFFFIPFSSREHHSSSIKSLRARARQGTVKNALLIKGRCNPHLLRQPSEEFHFE
ncbi:hypothetical protein NPIL_225521 [Nephila pilipes]|uniref:Uncharacterized protein n=1 Tax=Nephila pilipes TaxID=299642 RepID=A0A8X6UQQ6_NEPPI|nr:hypothetical protein NPIL_225521 [Nephila pilipes]